MPRSMPDLRNAALAARYAELGGTVIPGSPDDFSRLIRDETEKWGKVIRDANIQGGLIEVQHEPKSRVQQRIGAVIRLRKPRPPSHRNRCPTDLRRMARRRGTRIGLEATLEDFSLSRVDLVAERVRRGERSQNRWAADVRRRLHEYGRHFGRARRAGERCPDRAHRGRTERQRERRPGRGAPAEPTPSNRCSDPRRTRRLVPEQCRQLPAAVRAAGMPVSSDEGSFLAECARQSATALLKPMSSACRPRPSMSSPWLRVRTRARRRWS